MGKADARWRCRGYLDFVRTLPCVLSGQPADCAHHLIGLGGLGGMGVKAPDWAVMPLTHEAHHQLHQTPDLWPQQWEWIARTLGAAIDEGVIGLGTNL